jgi:hypothetical protein
MQSFPSEAVASRVLEILEMAGDQGTRLAEAARRRGISLEQLLAAAITEAVREVLTEAPRGRR